MRLTLRTLLAYLDGNLEPDDSEDIRQKVEESEFATKLVHLIRDCTRRLRLGAPALTGRGLAADPNSVAEYLEYRLSDERVPEFERICLESEIHLAEVASCHQILTLVLGEPAEIIPQTRQRLYALAAHADTPPAEEAQAPGAASASTAAIPPAPPTVRRPKPEVPDYLRESRWRWWPVAALVLFAATLTFGGLLLFGPPELRQRVIGMGPAPAEEAEAPKGEPAEDEPREPQPEVEPAKEDTPPEPTGEEEADAADAEPAIVVPRKRPVDESDALPAPEPPQPKPADPSDVDAPADSPREPAAEEPATAPEDEPTDPAPEEAPIEEPAPATPAAEATPEAAGRQPAEGFGRFISQSDVLLRLDPKTGDWLRLPSTAPLKQGDVLLSLPSFRPTIQLSSNITIQADGAARFEFVGWTPEGVPMLALEFGRLLMMTVGRADNSLQLKLDGGEPLLTFVDAESTLAVDVGRDRLEGEDPEAAAAPLTATVYATSGLIRLRNGDVPIELQSPAERSLIGPADEPTNADFPPWVTSEEQSDFDQPGSDQVDRYLETDKPVGLQLRELADPQRTRRREVRSLAIRGLTYLGDFEPCVKAMNDENERLFWPVAMDELRAAVARNPETAARVRKAFENERGADGGADLYRTLWGYTAADLRAGADRELVEGLASDSLDVRVMSFLALRDVTGATHGYRPDDQEIRRRSAYNVWKNRIGKIAPRSDRAGSRSRPRGR